MFDKIGERRKISRDVPLLSVENLTISFPGNFVAVRDISFKISENETMALVGESGCGKSMTSLAIMGLVPSPGKITSGKIFFKGRNLLDLDEKELTRVRGKQISMIFQEPMTSLNPVLTIGFQLAEAYRLHFPVSQKEALQRASELLDLVRIPDAKSKLHLYPHQFSGGMRQRVMIAMALMCNPQLLIADEPTTALDVTIQAEILDLLESIQKEFKTSILFITHDLALVNQVSQKMLVMYAGQVMERGNVDSIIKDPAHPYTQALLGCLPMIGQKKSMLKVIPGRVPRNGELVAGCVFEPRCDQKLSCCEVTVPQENSLSEGQAFRCHLEKHGR